MTLEEALAILRSPEGREESRRVRVLGRAVDFAEVNMREGHLTRADAEDLVDACAALAEEYFPGSGDTFQIIYGVRFRRVLEEVFGPNN
jgi:hypothetical protein